MDGGNSDRSKKECDHRDRENEHRDEIRRWRRDRSEQHNDEQGLPPRVKNVSRRQNTNEVKHDEKDRNDECDTDREDEFQNELIVRAGIDVCGVAR